MLGCGWFAVVWCYVRPSGHDCKADGYMHTHTHTHPNTHTWTDQDHGKQAGREERRTGHWGQTAGAWLRGGGTCPLSLPPPVVGSFPALSLPSSRWSSLLCVTLALVLASNNGRFYLAPQPSLVCSAPSPAMSALRQPSTWRLAGRVIRLIRRLKGRLALIISIRWRNAAMKRETAVAASAILLLAVSGPWPTPVLGAGFCPVQSGGWRWTAGGP